VGYYRVNAKLLKNQESVADGFDDIYTVDYLDKVTSRSKIQVIESDGIIKEFLKTSQNINTDPFNVESGKPDIIIIGNQELSDLNTILVESVVDQVIKGVKLIVLENADVFAKIVNSKLKNKPQFYKRGGIIRRRNSGRQFVGYSQYLQGLPQAQAMGWEYQYFYSTKSEGRNGLMSGLSLETMYSDWIVSLAAQDTKEILCALNRIELGKGEIFLSTLNILPGLASNDLNSVVAKKLFLNLIENNSTK